VIHNSLQGHLEDAAVVEATSSDFYVDRARPIILSRWCKCLNFQLLFLWIQIPSFYQFGVGEECPDLEL